MSTTTATRPSPQSPWNTHPQRLPSKLPSTTPLGPPIAGPASVGQAMPPFLSPTVRSSHLTQDYCTPTPNYFGFISEPATDPTDSNIGLHAKANRNPPSSTARATVKSSPKRLPLDASPTYEAFRRQSEKHTFTLGHGSLSQFSMSPPAQKSSAFRAPDAKTTDIASSAKSPRSMPRLGHDGSHDVEDRMDLDSGHYRLQSAQKDMSTNSPSFFDIPREQSPASMPHSDSPPLQKKSRSHQDEVHSRLSLPYNKANPTPPSSSLDPQHRAQQRADTLPPRLQTDGPLIVPPEDVAKLMKAWPQDLLLLDLRVSPQYSMSRISSALNLCIPTTLLKRPSYNVQRLAETFTIEAEKSKFAHWKETRFIVVYDASSSLLRDASSSLHTLKKFANEGWKGNAYVVRGGFAEFSSKFPELVDRRPTSETQSSSKKTLSIEASATGAAPVAGGCPMPSTVPAANAFFGNIRQNTDLIGGVGQMPIKNPTGLAEYDKSGLPRWLLQASDPKDSGKLVSDRFLAIEKAEQRRLQRALSGNVSYGSPASDTPKSVQIAGIEKGSKNRYNNIWPYDHTRVRLQRVSSGDCDYINASHVKAAWTNKHYIATQAPMPATYQVRLTGMYSVLAGLTICAGFLARYLGAGFSGDHYADRRV